LRLVRDPWRQARAAERLAARDDWRETELRKLRRAG
jgi:hypothetical protein